VSIARDRNLRSRGFAERAAERLQLDAGIAVDESGAARALDAQPVRAARNLVPQRHRAVILAADGRDGHGERHFESIVAERFEPPATR